jgi:putative ABC transport system permease protein
MVSVRSLSDAFREDSALGLFGTLLAAAGLVLLTACLNLVALLLARGIDRGRELALRTALGASRSVLVRQLVTETAVLGLVSSVAALLFAAASLNLLRASLPAEITVHIEGWNNLGLESRLIVVIPPLALLVGLAAGIMPAILASRGDLLALREAGRGVVRTPARQRVRQGMVAAEIAFAQALLIAAGLSAAGGIRLANQPGGFDARNLLTFNLSLPEMRYRSETSRQELAAELSARIHAMPAVEGVAVANVLPASGWNPTIPFVIEDQPVTDPALRPRTGYRVISPGYFETLRIPILKGRAFDVADDEDGQPVIVLGASAAERFWPGQNPVGKRVRLDDHEGWLTVVGVAGDVNMYNWWDGADQSAVYLPLRQAPVRQSLQFAVRTSAEVTPFSSLREALHSLDPLLSLDNARTMRDAIEQATRGLTWMGWLLGICGGIGALLAVLGIYGIMAYTVAQREHEFGVRMAVGATRRDVVRLTMRQAGMVTGVGVFIGVLLAWGFGRAMESAMAGVISLHAGAFLLVSPVLALVALVAAYLPARRAALVDPMEALRSE